MYNAQRDSLKFRDIDLEFLDRSWEWLNDAGFRALILAAPPNRTAQLQWYESLLERQDYKIWGVQILDAWVGAFGIKNIDRQAVRAEYWGYIYPSEYVGVGIGFQMFRHSAEYAKSLGLRELYLNVASGNQVARRAYLRWGFSENGATSPGVVRMEIAL